MKDLRSEDALCSVSWPPLPTTFASIPQQELHSGEPLNLMSESGPRPPEQLQQAVAAMAWVVI